MGNIPNVAKANVARQKDSGWGIHILLIFLNFKRMLNELGFSLMTNRSDKILINMSN